MKAVNRIELVVWSHEKLGNAYGVIDFEDVTVDQVFDWACAVIPHWLGFGIKEI